jgi:hypothetical protein
MYRGRLSQCAFYTIHRVRKFHMIFTIDVRLDNNLILSSSNSFGKYSALPDKMQLAGRKYPRAGSDVDQDVQAVARGEASQHIYAHHYTLHS